MRRLWISALFLFYGLVGCTETKITPTDLIGNWDVTEDTQRHLPAQFRTVSSRITIAENGTFSAIQVPSSIINMSEEKRVEFVNGAGSWKLNSDDTKQNLLLLFKSIEGAKSAEVPFGTQVEIAHVGAKIVLFYFQGDPDEAKRIKFEKKAFGAN